MNSSLKFFARTLLKIVICLAAFVPLVLGGAGNLVLCLGEEGHIAIEFAHNNPCHPSHDHPEKPLAAHQQRMPDDQCCSCLDIPITFENADRDPLNDNVHKTKDLTSRRLSHYSTIAANQTDTNPSILVIPSPPPLYNSLVSIRTTVLLN